MELIRKVKPGERVRLDEADADFTAGYTQARAGEEVKRLNEEVGDLQELLYAAHQNALLIVLQGMDTSGKDGTIKHVMSEVNPLGCCVTPFKVPTEEELAHDFLWRVHRATPRRGMIAIFNRSHYEDVLVARVHELVPPEVWERRYAHINDFERLLTDNGTIVLKFFLHIDRDEQEKRLLARERDIDKAWKLAAGDWKERERWDEYMSAYEDALSRCSTDEAPWYIVPANKKWYRNLAVASTIAAALRPYRKKWKEALDETARERLAELEAYRRERGE